MTLFLVWNPESKIYDVSKIFSESIPQVFDHARQLLAKTQFDESCEKTITAVIGDFWLKISEDRCIEGGPVSTCGDPILITTVELEREKSGLAEVTQRIQHCGILRRNRISQNA